LTNIKRVDNLGLDCIIVQGVPLFYSAWQKWRRSVYCGINYINASICCKKTRILSRHEKNETWILAAVLRKLLTECMDELNSIFVKSDVSFHVPSILIGAIRYWSVW